ncbi:unnamed protein product [Pleuronectes platessa]|uniref:Uncharacterized protein n=1 Tax=Pleuronectes platessa TaxID=8262 RepID=A0A9N7VQY3_PLEPL|nr:unnamed protein product [Pleuronectes platessa]
MADEARDARSEQLAVCVRYVSEGAVKERFLALTEIMSFDAQSIANELQQQIQNNGLAELKGQCMLLRFDGHGQIGPPSPTWNALSVPLRGSSESFSCSSHFSNYTSKWRTAHG